VGVHDVGRAVLQGVHVLLVEDQTDGRALLHSMLTYGGALVTTADSAETALASLARLVPEIVVCSLRPGAGWDSDSFLKRLRALPASEGGAVPVVAVTDSSDLPGPTSGPGAVFQAHVRRPVDPQVMCRTLAELADRYRESLAT